MIRKGANESRPRRRNGKVKIVRTGVRHLETLKSWFPDRASCVEWGGPDFRFPFSNETFLEDIHWRAMRSYSAIDAQNGLLTFGQYYEKAGRCHLARLVVDPFKRSKGIGRQFIRGLMEIGKSDLDANACSLFVMADNDNALACYRGIGFSQTEWPAEQDHLPGIVFMTSEGSLVY